VLETNRIGGSPKMALSAVGNSALSSVLDGHFVKRLAAFVFRSGRAMLIGHRGPRRLHSTCSTWSPLNLKSTDEYASDHATVGCSHPRTRHAHVRLLNEWRDPKTGFISLAQRHGLSIQLPKTIRGDVPSVVEKRWRVQRSYATSSS
jgi:hypothetical protein